ncbi:methylated-DNA--[protein]-cysteine S-methyltransferase [Candidatus Atribacteria bacterium 1244-E10-H5-B2]|nr:MAG: methylated-DNA--[protein]-cysteine S-methyltransferase [Candidatus Atribacteria bacterium 1244-E10-H5-B2]
MSEKYLKCTIFLTAWGWTGFVVDRKGLRIFVLPEERKEDVLFKIKKELKYNNLFEDNRGWESLIKKVKEYFAGKKVDFIDCQLNLDNYTNFQKKVLQIVKEIPYGEIRSYKEAAEAAGYPRAYRAVGNTMRNNPLPLIIPCHRIIKSDGGLGGFSGKEGIALKRKMIDLESKVK